MKCSSSTPNLPLAHKLIKLISNLCFSTFVLFVVLLTLLAVTYQPPDPWLHSSPNLASDLLKTTPNSTFRPDDSILSTGEDLSDLPPPPTATTTTLPPPATTTTTSCDADSPVNCSDPRALAAVQRFNARHFDESIVFLSYEPPVAGSRPGECDAAWRFRNRHEKSWRRYRDYRRFGMVVGDGCGSYEVVSAGRFRSGVNAAPIPKAPRSSVTVEAPVLGLDPEINDTIPVLGESEFVKGRFLYYTRGGDYCKGMNQFIWSFLCGLGEARFLNRTFVIDLGVCLARDYNPSGKDEEGKDFRFYFDFEHLKESASVVEESEFLRDWRRAERGSGRKGSDKISVRKVPTYKITPMELAKDMSTIIWRQFDGQEPENYWYRVCEGQAAKYVERPWDALWKSKRLTKIVSAIAGTMDWDYDAVHVVRGQKAANKELWPNLDADTAPGALVEKLRKLIQPMRNLYIATNEPFYNYFDKLRAYFKVHLLDDYKEMWGINSEWYNETLALNSGQPVEFDGYMRVAVDTEVLNRAKLRIETFNNLTMDCKDGINSC